MFKQPPSQEWLEAHKNDGPDVVGSDLEKEAPEQTTVSGQKPLSLILDEIEERANAATPGPWTHRTIASDPEGFVEAKNLEKPHPYGQEILGDDYFPELYKILDCAFVASARTDVPALVKALRRAIQGYETLADVAESPSVSVRKHAKAKLSRIAAILNQK
jgi:hypothetical protein